MSEQAVSKKGFFGRIQDVYTRPGAKQVVSVLYSVGAAVVIVGALFKIMHWPGAGVVLCIGMFTEVFLFLLGVFDKPHTEYHWQNVYPELLDDHAEGTTVGGATSRIAATSAPVLSEADMASLSNGIMTFTKTAEQLSGLTSLVEPTTQLASTLTDANAAAGRFTHSQDELTKAAEGAEASYAAMTTNLNAAEQQSSTFANSLTAVNGQLSSINSVYELHLNAIRMQNELFLKQNEHLAAATTHVAAFAAESDKLGAELSAAAGAGAEYKAGITKLAGQVSDLNKIYGNMLNSLNN